MKKALFIATVYKFFNFERNDISILKDLGYEVHIATNLEETGWLKDNTSIDDLGIIKHQINFGRSPFCRDSFVAYKQLKKLYKENDFEIIHFHTPVAAALGRFALNKKSFTKTIYTCHGFHFNKNSSLKNWILYYPLERFLSRKTDMIITINKEDYEVAKTFRSKYKEYIPGVGINLESINSLSYDKKDLRNKHSFKNEDFIILIIGELSKRKNQQVVIKALNNFKENVKLILLGEGNERKNLEELVSGLGLKSRVFFYGQQSREKVFEICRMADLGVIPSKIEGLGLAGLEMLASGLPVIGSNIQGIKDYVIDEITGKLCDPNSINDFKDAIALFIRDEELYAKCSVNAKEIVKQFDISITDKFMRENYKRVINEK